EAAAPELPVLEQVQRISRFYLEHWTRHQDYFQIFWAIDNQRVIGELPPTVVDHVTRLWEGSLKVLNDVLARGVEEGTFVEHDTWEVANILWTLANGILQSEGAAARRALRQRPLTEVFDDAIALVLKGLQPHPTGA
ncbi:MAG: hypothetical protein MJE66_19920, partial [Proteobacteria bacterium]|nr:hypothetical protein [Pseudomonadota bacterium]